MDKKVTLDLTGVDGNAYFLLTAFRRQAKKEGWTNEEITAVCTEAMKDDYDHLVTTLSAHCE